MKLTKEQLAQMSPEERRKALARLMQEKKKSWSSVIEMFSSQLTERPDNAAIITQQKTISYIDLARRTAAIQKKIEQASIESGIRVALAVNDAHDAIAALLALLNAKQELIIIPVNEQPEWQQKLAQYSGINTVVTDKPENYPSLVKIELPPSSSQADFEPASLERDQTGICFIEPGGILFQTHADISLQVQLLKKLLGVTAGEKLFCAGKVTLPGAIWEQLVPICSGAALVLSDNEEQSLADCVRQLRATSIVLPGDMASALAQDLEYKGSEVALNRIVLINDHVRTSVAALLKNHAKEIHYVFGLPRTLGPLCHYQYEPQLSSVYLPAGQLQRKQGKVLDAQLMVTADGTVGELAFIPSSVDQRNIESSIVADWQYRYLDSPEEQRPVVFLTGEKVRRNREGLLEYTDEEKRHIYQAGLPVPLSLIEKSINQAPGVNACHVQAHQADGRLLLVACIVASTNFSQANLLEFLSSQLPSSLIPDAVLQVTRLPLDRNGQVNTRLLKDLPVVDADLLKTYSEEVKKQQVVDDAAAVMMPLNEKPRRHHLSDLLKGWRSSSGDVGVENQNIPDIEKQQSIRAKEDVQLSVSEGDALPEGLPACLPDILAAAAEAFPDHGNTFVQADGSDNFISYKTLLDMARRIAGGLKKAGIEKGKPLIFQFDRNDDYVPALWGCILAGVVPMPLAYPKSMASNAPELVRLLNVWTNFDCPAVITRRQNVERYTSLDTGSAGSMRLFDIESLLDNKPLQEISIEPDDTAIILLTSGSTGLPKGVIQTHRALISRSAGTSIVNQHNEHDTSVNWMPLDHVGGVVMFHIRDVYNKANQVHVPTDYVLTNPLRWLDLIEKYRATTTWAPNFAFALINDRAEEIAEGSWKLDSMRFILNGGEAIVAKTARRFLKLLAPHGLKTDCMHPSWGMSETCSGVAYTTFDLETTSDSDPYVEIGLPVPGFCMRIVDKHEQVVPEGEIGALQVKGPSVLQGYYMNPEQNAESFTDDGWFRVGDLGRLHEGRLTITGREKDVIIINGINYASHEIETIAEDLPGVVVSYTAACAVRRPGMNTDELAIFFNTDIADDSDAELKLLLAEIRSVMASRAGVLPDYLLPVPRELIPKTEIGKIQRTQLSQRFAAGEFDSILRRVDLLLENQNTLAEWFYRRHWAVAHHSGFVSQPPAGSWVIFADEYGLGTSLASRLREIGREVCLVEARSAYRKLSASHFQIRPDDADDYASLCSELITNGTGIDQIVHCWGYHSQMDAPHEAVDIMQTQKRGIGSLICLLQTIQSKKSENEPVTLRVVTSLAQCIEKEDGIGFANGTLRGFVSSVPLEFPQVQCVLHDYDLMSTERHLSSLWQELRSVNVESSVFRKGKRFVSRLQPVSIDAKEIENAPVREHGMYVITGGLGGVALKIARYLLQRYQARLLLLDQLELPPSEELEQAILNGHEHEEKLVLLQELMQLPGEVCYAATDICDGEKVQHEIVRCRQIWQCELDGVLHLAGSYHDCLIKDETPDGVERAMQAKCLGAWTMFQVFNDEFMQRNDPNRQGLFLLFSSLVADFGGATISLYSAANSFLQNLVWYIENTHQRRWPVHTLCFVSSNWDDTGMSAGYQMQSLSRERGFEFMTPDQGIASLMAALSRPENELLVGLNPYKPRVRHLLKTEDYAAEKPKLFYAGDIDSGQSIPPFVDRVGRVFQIESCKIETIPLDSAGNPDILQLQELQTGERQGKKRIVEPRTETERRLLEIWQSVLHIEEIGVEDNFFEIGGNSILGVTLMGRLQKSFTGDLPMTLLFQAPTISELAKQIDQKHASENWTPLVPIKAEGSKSPLFLVHQGSGTVLCYAKLANLLGSDQPVYGLQARGLTPGLEAHTTLKEMAASYVEAVLDHQVQGPYRIGGWSFGALVAFEMARILEAQGQEVEHLAIIDGLPWIMDQTDKEASEKYDNVSLLITLVNGLSEHEAQLRALDEEEQLRFIARYLSEQGWMDAEQGIETVRGYFSVCKAAVSIRNEGPEPEPLLKGPMVLFKSEEMDEYFGNEYPGLRWDELTANKMPIEMLPGKHQEVIDEPAVTELAEKLKQYL